jgi:hypothetical protein
MQVALLLLLHVVCASAAMQTFQITSFSGTLDSVDVFLNGIGTVPTGPINLSLDSSKPATVVLDDSTNTMTNTFSVIFNMPLFIALGLPPDTLDFSESGPYVVLPGPVVSGLLAGSGGPSAAFAIEVGDINNTWNINTASSPSPGVWSVPQIDFTIIFPQNADFDPNGPQTRFTQGSGTFTVQVVPEPATLGLAAAAAGLMIAIRPLRKNK